MENPRRVFTSNGGTDPPEGNLSGTIRRVRGRSRGNHPRSNWRLDEVMPHGFARSSHSRVEEIPERGCEKVHLSSAYSACCRVLYSLKAATPELTIAAEGPF